MSPNRLARLTGAALILGALLAISGMATQDSNKKSGAELASVSERDARILVYLIPAASELRAKGRDVVLDRESNMEKEVPGKYVFRMEGFPQNPYGSSLMGYFDVDKSSGEVTANETNEAITSATLKGVQKIIVGTGSE